MSKLHPIIAVTGSSGAGTSTVRVAFEHMFRREQARPCFVQGDSFHRFDRREMQDHVRRAIAAGGHLSHFGPEGNHLDKLEALFRQYAESGTGKRRFYLHSDERAARAKLEPGTFTPWEDIEAGTDVLVYEGVHGAVVTADVDVARYVDLLIGVVPTVNLEWIQKIHRDTSERGYDIDEVQESILRRMHDYVHYITPQFSRSDINFQRVPTVDTSNPFTAREIPTADESFVVIRFREPAKFDIDFPYLLAMIRGSFMSRRNTIVVPGGKMGFAMEIILMPIVKTLMAERRALIAAEPVPAREGRAGA